MTDSDLFPDTSRPIRAGEKDGCGYWFTTREKMDEDIANHKYLEFGEYEKHLYGTKLDSIRQVMRSNCYSGIRYEFHFLKNFTGSTAKLAAFIDS